MNIEKIEGFQGEYRFLSNFWPVSIFLEGQNEPYPSVENAYQASKTLSIKLREEIRNLTAGKAKKIGQTLVLRNDWNNDLRIQTMKSLLIQKFDGRNPELVEKLLATGNAEIIEANTWGDTFFGVCDGKGENHLGKLLMEVRNNLFIKKYAEDKIAYVTVIDGKTVLIDPVGYAFMKAVNKNNCEVTFDLNADRIQYFKNHITEKELDPKTIVIVIINVDAPYGFEIAEALMPGYDWQQFRDKGEIPFARGIVMKEGIIEMIAVFDLEASKKISLVEGIPVIVVDHGVAEVFSV